MAEWEYTLLVCDDIIHIFYISKNRTRKVLLLISLTLNKIHTSLLLFQQGVTDYYNGNILPMFVCFSFSSVVSVSFQKCSLMLYSLKHGLAI
jgi:hypothetical protein